MMAMLRGNENHPVSAGSEIEQRGRTSREGMVRLRLRLPNAAVLSLTVLFRMRYADRTGTLSTCS
jgi:hypothetical protein